MYRSAIYIAGRSVRVVGKPTVGTFNSTLMVPSSRNFTSWLFGSKKSDNIEAAAVPEIIQSAVPPADVVKSVADVTPTSLKETIPLVDTSSVADTIIDKVANAGATAAADVLAKSAERGAWVYQGLEYFHAGGMTWMGSIIALTFCVRGALLPFFFKSLKTSAKFAAHNEALQEFAKRSSKAQQSGNKAELMAIFQERRRFMLENGMKFRYIFMNIAFSLPVAYLFISTLREMNTDGHLIPGYTTETFGLWSNPMAHDPYLVLPLVSFVLGYAAIHMNPSMRSMDQIKLTRNGVRLLAGSFIALGSIITASSPLSIQLYLAATAATMLMNALLLRCKPLLVLLDFPDNWPQCTMTNQRNNFSDPVTSSKMPQTPVSAMFEGLVPVGEALSSVAALVYREKITVPLYVTPFGLRDPGVPPPPAPKKKEILQ